MKYQLKVILGIILIIIFFRSSTLGQEEIKLDDKLTILGEKRANPYTTEIMSKAWQELNPDSKIKQMPVTDIYVKFKPNDYDQLAILEELNITLFDYPLEYEIKEMGDYYIAPNKEIEDIPEYYTVVDSKFKFPEVEHEIIAELHLADYDTYLTQKAFELTGNEYSGKPEGEASDINLKTMCSDNDPNWPECQCDIFLEHDDLLGYEECLEEINNPPPPPPPVILNDCGCRVYADRRKPAGRVMVEDTQLETEGVRNVQVIAIDGWFKVLKTQTDSDGCWKINNRFSGKAWFVVRFKSDRVSVRAIRGIRIWQYSRAVEHKIGKKWGPDFNDICVQYNPENDDGSKAKLYLHAAHANNALYDYDSYCTQDNITRPPQQLKILLTNRYGAASAPMLKQLKESPAVQMTLTNASSNGVSFAFGSLVNEWIPVISNLAPILYKKVLKYLLSFPPDIFYQYGENNHTVGNPNATNSTNTAFIAGTSDNVKYVLYHEYGHASHYAGLSNPVHYWMREIDYTIKNEGYGDGTANGAERPAIVESWAEFIGLTYTDRKYGLDHGWPSNLPFRTDQRRFIYRNTLSGQKGELHIPAATGIPNEFDWIPYGLFRDCVDNRIHNNLPLNLTDPVVEFIEGYSIRDCFNAIINNSATTLNQVEQNLLNDLPQGQNAADIQGLLQFYGY